MRKTQMVINVVNWVLEALCLCFAVMILFTVVFSLEPKFFFVGLIGVGVVGLVRVTWIPLVINVLSVLNWIDEKVSMFKEYQRYIRTSQG